MKKNPKNKEVILKIPFDGANLKRKGASKAPELLSKKFPKLRKVNVKVNTYNFEETQENISKAAFNEFSKGNFVISLGGDHSVTYGLLQGAKKVFEDISLLYFDAHLDAEDDFIPPSHEDVIKAIVNEKIIKPSNILIVGARKYWKKEEEFIQKNKIKVAFASEKKHKITSKIEKFIKKARNLYISVDIDFFDQSVAVATAYPEKNGFFLKDFKKFTTWPEFKRIIGCDIVEFFPCLDKQQISQTLASNVIKELLTKRDNFSETYI